MDLRIVSWNGFITRWECRDTEYDLYHETDAASNYDDPRIPVSLRIQKD